MLLAQLPVFDRVHPKKGVNFRTPLVKTKLEPNRVPEHSKRRPL